MSSVLKIHSLKLRASRHEVYDALGVKSYRMGAVFKGKFRDSKGANWVEFHSTEPFDA
jgi:hypothetical protein